MAYSTPENEAIGLCIALEAINDIANKALLEIRNVSRYPGEAEVYFHGHIHQQLFLIRLLDFVKENGDNRLTGVSGSCLQVLKSSCDTKSFEFDNSASSLSTAVNKLEEWLNYETPIKFWLPTLDIEADISVKRLTFLFISGNYLKHNLSRLTAVSRNIHEILEKGGYTAPIEHIPLAIEDFREHLQENYFIYYGTWLGELLNNIRWGIQDYLTPQFLKSHKKDDPESLKYYFEYPDFIQHDVPRRWFWRLLNNIRAKPYLPRFKGAHYLKEQSSLEWRD